MTESPQSGEVVVMISGQEKDVNSSCHRVTNDLVVGTMKFASISSPSHENDRSSSSPNRPPKIPTKEIPTRRKSLARSMYSKPKSRFGEQPVFVNFEENSMLMQEYMNPSGNSPIKDMQSASPKSKVASTYSSFKDTRRTVSITTPRTPLMASSQRMDEDEEIYKIVSTQNRLKYKKVKIKVLLQWLFFLMILGSLVSCLTIDRLEHTTIWGLELWKWFLLVIVSISGLMFTSWFMHFVVLLIELNFLLRKVLYFVHGLKRSARVCLWLTLVLATWLSLFNNGVKRSVTAEKVLDYITWTIVSLLIGSFLWLFKTLLLKMLASSFHVTTFFDRIQESDFHQYILQVLSGPPLLESAEMFGRTNSISQFSFRCMKKDNQGKEKTKTALIDINKLHKMKQEKVSAWTMKMLVDVISNTRLSTISDALDETNFDGNAEQTDKEITNEMEAIAAAYHVFKNVAQPGYMYIDELDLRRFMIKEEVDIVFPLIDVAETGQIDKKVLTEWVVKVYNGRKVLAHALSDTKTAVKQLNSLVTAILIVINSIVWLLLVGIATTKVLLFLSSQLLAAVFLFGNACKTTFEAIIFVFVMHPFDVGDRCVIDGVQVFRENASILASKSQFGGEGN